MPAAPSSLSITLQIVSIVFYTFIAFICIGLPIAVIPGYVHEQLGFSAVVAGVTIGSQYLATLLSRPMAGRMSDNVGTKRAIVLGLAGILISGVLTFIATLLDSLPSLSLGILIAGRLLLGGDHQLVHGRSGRRAHRTLDFLEWHRLLWRHCHWCAVRRGDGG